MSDIDDLIESIHRQLQRNGLDEVKAEVAKVFIEIQKVQELVSSTFLQDFRYDNVEKLTMTLRAVQYEVDYINRSIGSPENTVNEAVSRIRNA